jgi:protein-S-isoprenylcysteine O-methyltransferase Ste14
VTVLPTLRLGFANQWIPLLLYAGALILSVMRLPNERRQWLFEDPKAPLRGGKKLLLRLGQLLAMIIIGLFSLTPLWGAPIWLCAIGWSMYVVGTGLVVASIYYFGRAPIGQPVMQGPYRVSRNPQWVGLWLVFLGLAISGGSALLVLAVLGLGAVYHIQIIEEEKACRAKFGPPYEEYLRTVPRYLLTK